MSILNHHQKIIGFIEWFRSYIKNLSQKLSGINYKTSKNGKLIWNKEDTEVIYKILDGINNTVGLTIPRTDIPFQLETDASNEAIGSVLH